MVGMMILLRSAILILSVAAFNKKLFCETPKWLSGGSHYLMSDVGHEELPGFCQFFCFNLRLSRAPVSQCISGVPEYYCNHHETQEHPGDATSKSPR